jgi:hypothetical protein
MLGTETAKAPPPFSSTIPLENNVLGGIRRLHTGGGARESYSFDRNPGLWVQGCLEYKVTHF